MPRPKIYTDEERIERFKRQNADWKKFNRMNNSACIDGIACPLPGWESTVEKERQRRNNIKQARAIEIENRNLVKLEEEEQEVTELKQCKYCRRLFGKHITFTESLCESCYEVKQSWRDNWIVNDVMSEDEEAKKQPDRVRKNKS